MQNNKTKIIIPKDVQKHINKRIAKRVVKAAALFAFTVFALVWYVQDFWTSIRLWTVPVYAGILIAVYFLSGINAVIRDRTWCGVIKEAEVKTTLTSLGGARGSRQRYWVNTVHIVVETEDGKTEKCIAFQGRADDARDGAAMSFYLKNYAPGVGIVHIRGAEHYQIDPDNNPDTMNCVVCGYDNREGAEICETCGHTLRLIKKDETMWFYG